MATLQQYIKQGTNAPDLYVMTSAQSNAINNAEGTLSSTNVLLSTASIDDTPVDAATTAPISSNWAFDHTADVDAHVNGATAGNLLVATASTTASWQGTGVKLSAPDISGVVTATSALTLPAFIGSGKIRLNSTGLAWDDLRTPVTAVKLPGVNPPTWTTYRNSELLGFAYEAVNEESIYFSLQFPHNYMIGTEIAPHIHWTATTDTAADVKWAFEYSWANIGSTFPTTTTLYKVESTGSTPDTHLMTEFDHIVPATTADISSMMICKLYRNSSATTDTYSGAALFLEFDIHYQIDSFGSEQETTKT